ncbi:hypothetical protein MKX03_000328 [Papaver bracteatum]|nr:hypothetical protein MKX03_000328 [Papaver bracteatum]
MYDVIGHHLNSEIRKERVNVKILVVKRLMMAICGSGDFGYEVHRMLLGMVTDQDSSKRIKGYLKSRMTEVRNKLPHSEDSGILAVWYDFDDQDRPTPGVFECNSSNLSVTVNIVQRGFSFGGSCDSDILSYVPPI